MVKVVASKRVQSIGSYAFKDVDDLVARLKAEGVEPIDFGVGDPKAPTPTVIRVACKKAVDIRKTSGYPSYVGSKEYRTAVAEWIKKRFGVSLDPEKEITSTIGAKEGIFNFAEGFVNPGDIVLCPNPGYPPYERGTLFAEGVPYFVNLVEKNNFLPVLSEIPKDVVAKAKILWINYPNNPTTALATKEFLKEVIDFGHDNNIIIASDECYSEMYYDEKPMSILELGREGIVAFQSLSKRSNMTCYRIGSVAGDENIISVFKKVKTNIDSGTTTFIQDAAIAALSDEKHVEKMRKEYATKINIFTKAAKTVGWPVCKPKGTFYIWQKCSDSLSSVDFSKKLLQKEIAIVTTPGPWISKEVDGFNPGEGYVRFAFVPTIEQTKVAAERLMKYWK